MQTTLRPEAITKSNPAPPNSFYNFMTGGSGSPISSSFSSAANKIVNFSGRNIRGDSGATNSLISNISTDISNIQNQSNIQNLFQNTKGIIEGLRKQNEGVLSKLIKSFTDDYQKRVQDIELRKSSGILKSFLKLYENAVGLVTFFGDVKNHQRLNRSLKTLRRIFNESFEVAALIRKTIVKIVKQLSNLPSASGKAPNLSLDVNIPGGRSRAARMPQPRGRGSSALALAGAAGAFGLGAMTTSAVSDGTQRARQFQEEELSSTATGTPSDESVTEGFLDTFESIISRFSSTVDKLIEAGRKASNNQEEETDSSSVTPTSASPGEPVSSSSAGLNLAFAVAALEATGKQNISDVFQSMLNRANQNYGNYGRDLASQVLARDQYTPIHAIIYGPNSGDSAANQKYAQFGPRFGRNPQERKTRILQMMATPQGMEEFLRIIGRADAIPSAREVRDDWLTGGSLSRGSSSFIGGAVEFRADSWILGELWRGMGGNRFKPNPGVAPAFLQMLGIPLGRPTSTQLPGATPGTTTGASSPNTASSGRNNLVALLLSSLGGTSDRASGSPSASAGANESSHDRDLRVTNVHNPFSNVGEVLLIC